MGMPNPSQDRFKGGDTDAKCFCSCLDSNPVFGHCFVAPNDVWWPAFHKARRRFLPQLRTGQVELLHAGQREVLSPTSSKKIS